MTQDFKEGPQIHPRSLNSMGLIVYSYATEHIVMIPPNTERIRNLMNTYICSESSLQLHIHLILHIYYYNCFFRIPTTSGTTIQNKVTHKTIVRPFVTWLDDVPKSWKSLLLRFNPLIIRTCSNNLTIVLQFLSFVIALHCNKTYCM